MTSLKNLFQTLTIPFAISFSKSRTTQIFSIILLTIALFFFSSSTISPASINSPNPISSPLHFASFYISSIISSNTRFVKSTCSDAATFPVFDKSRKSDFQDVNSCDLFDGNWAFDDSDSYAIYKPGSCPFIDNSFDCFTNGRPDSEYLKLRWKPNGCHIPRFDGVKMLKMLRGKRMVFVGDSLNRNMWESLICALRESLTDKSRVIDVSGRRKFRTQGFYSFRFKDYNCSIDFIKSPFLVQEWKISDKAGIRRETLRLDMIQGSSIKYQDADFIIFNTGHWWTHQKTYKGNNYFQEGSQVYSKLEVAEAYTRALRTWSQWVDSNINPSKTSVFFVGYSASHFKGGQWNSGGSCKGETHPITNGTYISSYPWMMSVLESVLDEMRTPVFYMNVTKMTDYRKDGHPSVYRQMGKGEQRHNKNVGGMVQDCSHWCLPGVPDSWNELLYATILMSYNGPV